MRVQGGSSGLIAAIVAGRLDPFDALHEDERGGARWDRTNGSDFRESQRRDRYHSKKCKRRMRDRLADLCPF